jgi:hypothetical protein
LVVIEFLHTKIRIEPAGQREWPVALCDDVGESVWLQTNPTPNHTHFFSLLLQVRRIVITRP